MFTSKGSYGYIRGRRSLMLLLTILTLAVTLAIYFTAKWYFHTNRNIFTILAALCCIGVGKCATDMVMFFRAGCCTKSAMENIELHLGKLPGLYDLYLTTYNKDFQISHIVVSGLQVCGFTQTKNCDVRAAEQHIQTMLEHDGYVGYTVHIYKSLDQYLDCLDALEQIRDPKEHKSSKGVTDLLLSISL